MVPAVPATSVLDVGERADDRPACPVARAKSQAAIDLGQHRARRRTRRACSASSASGCAPAMARCVGVPKPRYDARRVGRHDEHVGVEVAGQQAAGVVLVDDGLDAAELAGRRRTRSGCRRRRRRSRRSPCSSSQRIWRCSKIRFGAGDGTTRRRRSPSGRNVQPRSAASVVGLRAGRRSGRWAWSGRRTPGRPGRPRSS